MLTKKLGNKKNVTKELNVHGTDDNSSWHTGKFWKPEKNILGFLKDWKLVNDFVLISLDYIKFA